MSGSDDMNDKERLACLDDLVMGDILSSPDAEILRDADDSRMAAARAQLTASLTVAGKQRLALAKTSVALDRARPRVGGSRTAMVPPTSRSPRLQISINDQRVTLAARGDAGHPGTDADGIQEDLAELEAWEEEDRSRS